MNFMKSGTLICKHTIEIETGVNRVNNRFMCSLFNESQRDALTNIIYKKK